MAHQRKLTEAFPKRRTRTVGNRKKSLKETNLDQLEDDHDFNYESNLSQQLAKVDSSSLESFRKALDTSSPKNLPGREAQIRQVNEFLSEHLNEKKPGSLYISGAPGTGKTAVVNFVLNQITEERAAENKKAGFHQIFINCMCKRSASQIYEIILEKFRITTRKTGSLKDQVEEKLLNKSKLAYMIVVVLDEMDQFIRGSNEVLYTLFEWARTPNSKLILIGVANALDLTVRHLPFLHLNNGSPVKLARGADGNPILPQNECRTMSFPPYFREDIEKIIQERMGQVGQNIFAPTAIKFVAAKVAASTGDARKALHACKEAIVSTEKQERSLVNKSIENAENVTSNVSISPKKMCVRNDQIGVLAVSKAFQTTKDDGPLPLQQVTILASLMKLHREAPANRDSLVDGVNKPIPLSSVFRQYRKICSLKGFSWIEESELPMVCEVLQDRSLLSLVNTGNSTGKKLSFGSKKFGSPSTGQGAKLGVIFDPRVIQGLVVQGDLKDLFG